MLIEPFTFPKDGNAAFQITRDALKDMFGGFGTEVLPISIVREGDEWVCTVRVRELLGPREQSTRRFRVRIGQSGVDELVDLEDAESTNK